MTVVLPARKKPAMQTPGEREKRSGGYKLRLLKEDKEKSVKTACDHPTHDTYERTRSKSITDLETV